jgi:hypothetical protein
VVVAYGIVDGSVDGIVNNKYDSATSNKVTGAVMAATAQTRITEETRERIARLAEQTGKSQQEVIDVAVRIYERELFLTQVNEGYAALRGNDAAWADELKEREEWDGALSDGIEDT